MTATMDSGGGERRVRRLGTHGTAVHAIVGAWAEGRPVVVTGADDGAVQMWELTSGAEQRGVRLALADDLADQVNQTGPTALAASPSPGMATPPESSSVLVGWSDGTIGAVNLATAAPVYLRKPVTHAGPVTAIEVVADVGLPRRCVSAGSDVLTWDELASDRETMSLHGLHKGDVPAWILAVTGDPQSRVVCAGVGDGVVQRWAFGSATDLDRVTRQKSLRLGSAKRSPLLICTAETLDGPVLLATDFDHLATWDVAAERPGRQLDPGVGQISALQTTIVDGRPAVAVGSVDGRVAVMDPVTAEELEEPIDIGEPVSDLGGLRSDERSMLLVGGAKGGVYAVPLGEPAVLDKVELQDDRPAQTRYEDRLRRNPLAQALAVRLKRRHEEGREASFLIHLDGRWGSGKTTVLNLVAAELGDGWTIVSYNAWRQARVGPPWWTLLTALRDEMQRRRSLPRRAVLWWREMVHQRIRRASGLPATLLLVLLAAAVFLLVRPRDTNVGETLSSVQGVAAALTALATLFAGAQFVARFFGWHSPRGAKAFEDLDTNPMDRVAGHFAWLVRQERRPIAFFVDDIDRCDAEHVVELLEAVQTLVRDAAGSAEEVLSPCFVVAGDGAWIRNAFEEHYSAFAGPIAEPGRPLGYLFLAKIFQLMVPVPRIGPVRQSQYFRELLGLQDEDAVAPETVDSARKDVEAAANDEAQQQVLAGLSQAVREVVAPVAVQRQTERSFAAATEHRLSGFAPLLPDNPRAVKRFLNAFALTRSVRTVEGQAIPTATLALWTILETRWPLLADYLANHPNCLTVAGDDRPALPAQVPETIRLLLEDPDVQTVLDFADGGPLTPDLIVACRGG